MPRYFSVVLQASLLVHWLGESFSICNDCEATKGVVPLVTVQDWINFVPCPPPNMFSLLCLEVSDCDLLLSILDVCLSQYDRVFGQSFTDAMKCSEKRTCESKREICQFDEKINVTCYWSTGSIPSDVTNVTSTTWPTSTSPRTTTQTTKQTTEQTTTTYVTNSTIPNVTLEQNFSMPTSIFNPAFSNEPTEEPKPSSSMLVLPILMIILVIFIVCSILLFAAKRRYDIRVKTRFNRQISTDSQVPILRSDRGFDCLCLSLERRVKSPRKGPESPRGAYSAVSTTEKDHCEGHEKFGEPLSVIEKCDTREKDCDVPFIDDFPAKKWDNNDNSNNDGLERVLTEENGNKGIKNCDEPYIDDIPKDNMEKKENIKSDDVELTLFSEENGIKRYTNCEDN